jgi:hypothetical protein
MSDHIQAAIAPLLVGKKKLTSGGLHATYRLSNGWLASIRRTQSGWRDRDYWTIRNGEQQLGGGETLEKALRNTVVHGNVTV